MLLVDEFVVRVYCSYGLQMSTWKDCIGPTLSSIKHVDTSCGDRRYTRLELCGCWLTCQSEQSDRKIECKY